MLETKDQASNSKTSKPTRRSPRLNSSNSKFQFQDQSNKEEIATTRDDTNTARDEIEVRDEQGTIDANKATIQPELSKEDCIILSEKEIQEIKDELQCLMQGTSDKFVPHPEEDDIILDVMHGIKRLIDRARWMEFNKQNLEEQLKRLELRGNDIDKEKELEKAHNEKKKEERGLNTGMRPTKIDFTAPKGSDDLEAFLKKEV